MSKKELIIKLIKEFEKDKKVIVTNLIKVMDVINLEASNEYGKVTLTIKYERNDK